MTAVPSIPPSARPEDVGLSSERLARIASVFNADIAQERLAGAVVMIVRRGKLAYLEAFGHRDKAAGVAMTADTLFNIASMTKPMTAVAALQLYEQGRLTIDDPVEKFFPQFAGTKVAVMDEDGQRIAATIPAKRKITIQDLMRHTSGLVYGGRGTSDLHKLYPDGSGPAAMSLTGSEFIDKLASLPVLHQPGTVWDYGFGLDVLGLVVEQIAGQSLGAYMREHIWEPLGMGDTGFHIPPDKAARYAKALPNDPIIGKPQAVEPDLTRPLKFECGGSCVASTAGDYMRFIRMLMNDGKLGEARILGRKTTEYMLSNQLGPEVKNLIGNADPTRADYGFGLGLAVRTTPGIVRMMGAVGEFSWPGASGTNWWADPKEDLAVVFMSAAPGPIRWHYRQVINALVYQAIAY